MVGPVLSPFGLVGRMHDQSHRWSIFCSVGGGGRGEFVREEAGGEGDSSVESEAVGGWDIRILRRVVKRSGNASANVGVRAKGLREWAQLLCLFVFKPGKGERVLCLAFRPET